MCTQCNYAQIAGLAAHLNAPAELPSISHGNEHDAELNARLAQCFRDLAHIVTEQAKAAKEAPLTKEADGHPAVVALQTNLAEYFKLKDEVQIAMDYRLLGLLKSTFRAAMDGLAYQLVERVRESGDTKAALQIANFPDAVQVMGRLGYDLTEDVSPPAPSTAPAPLVS